MKNVNFIILIVWFSFLGAMTFLCHLQDQLDQDRKLIAQLAANQKTTADILRLKGGQR